MPAGDTMPAVMWGKTHRLPHWWTDRAGGREKDVEKKNSVWIEWMDGGKGSFSQERPFGLPVQRRGRVQSHWSLAANDRPELGNNHDKWAEPPPDEKLPIITKTEKKERLARSQLRAVELLFLSILLRETFLGKRDRERQKDFNVTALDNDINMKLQSVPAPLTFGKKCHVVVLAV